VQPTYGDHCHSDVDGVDAHHGKRDGVCRDLGVDEDTARVEEYLQNTQHHCTPQPTSALLGA